MSKSYSSGAAKRKARQERAEKDAKMPKISAFLKHVDKAPDSETTLGIVTEVTESTSALTSAVATVAMDMCNQTSTSETMVTVTVPVETGNDNEVTSSITQGPEGYIEQTATVESSRATINEKKIPVIKLISQNRCHMTIDSWPFLLARVNLVALFHEILIRKESKEDVASPSYITLKSVKLE